MGFFIEKIIAKGKNKKDSVIELKPGVNIIYGPSNTGKTCIVRCMDYLFGSSNIPIDSSTGYDCIIIKIITNNGSLIMERRFGTNKIIVTSNDSNYLSGEYKSTTSQKGYDKTINSLWLSLIGIKEMHLINSDKHYNKKILSWRNLVHMFLITETKIISEISVILSFKYTNSTAELSSLLYLLNGNESGSKESQESTKEKETKRGAIKKYIDNELCLLEEHKGALLSKIEEYDDINFENEIGDISVEIKKNENAINTIMKENQNVLLQLTEKNEKLSECNMLLDRYTNLLSQYQSDIERLSFIIDGEANIDDKILTKCPVCNSNIEATNNMQNNFIEAARGEYKKICLQVKDLKKVIEDLTIEKKMVEDDLIQLKSKKQSAENFIGKTLQPHLDLLEDKLKNYKCMIEYKKEISIIEKIFEKKQKDILDNEIKEENNFEFKVKDYFGYDFFSDLNSRIKEFLKKCNCINVDSVFLEKTTMDVVINNKKKGVNGKGYNAYYNSVVAIVFAQYLHDKAIYAPNFLTLDSPILSFKENSNKKPSQTMRNGLFENIIKNYSDMQTIIIENEIPDINYDGVNLIEFTKDKNNGRYGFLYDIYD